MTAAPTVYLVHGALGEKSGPVWNRVHPGAAPVGPDSIYLPFVTLVSSAGYGKNNI